MTTTMTHPAVRQAAPRTAGHPTGRRANGTAIAGDPGRHAAAARELDCEAGCHYCQGPETD